MATGRALRWECQTLDRCLGLATLLLVGAVAVGLKASWLWDENVEGLNHFGLPGGRILVITIVAGVVLILAFALLVTNKRVRGSQRLSRLLRGVPFRRTLVRVYDAMHLYGDKPGALVRAAAVSIAAQVPLYAIYYLCGRAVGADIELWHCALIVPPARVIRVLPLMPAGAGQGMVAMGVLFKLVKIKQGAAIGAVGDVMFLAACLIGGLFFVFGKTDYNDMRAAAEPDAESEPGAQ